MYRIPVGLYHASTLARGEFAATLCLVDSSARGDEVTLGPLDGASHVTFRRPVALEDAASAFKELAVNFLS